MRSHDRGPKQIAGSTAPPSRVDGLTNYLSYLRLCLRRSGRTDTPWRLLESGRRVRPLSFLLPFILKCLYVHGGESDIYKCGCSFQLHHFIYELKRTL